MDQVKVDLRVDLEVTTTMASVPLVDSEDPDLTTLMDLVDTALEAMVMDTMDITEVTKNMDIK